MIGERLEEARKRKNVSIRESAEATKIRGDYLIAMEDNSFDIPLPQIYIRGFLKNYARFLKLDPNKILTDYDAFLLGRNSPVASSASGTRATAPDRESLGQINIPDDEPEGPAVPEGETMVVTEAPEEDDGPDPELHFRLEPETAPAPTSQPAAQSPTAPPPPTLEREGMRHDPESWNENKTLYMKIGIVFAGILLVSIILIVLIQLIRGGDETPALNPELANQSSVSAEPEAAAPVPASTDGPIVITASDNVTLIVEQTIDRKRLYSGSLNAGETLSLDKEGPVSIRFTNGSALVIEQGGQTFRPGQAGVGRTVVQ